MAEKISTEKTDAEKIVLAQFEEELPPAPNPIGSYVTAVRVGNLLFTSGMLPLRDGQVAYTGAVGKERTVEEAQDAARLCAMNGLSVVRHHLGSLANVKRVVKVSGFVNAASDFSQHPAVINGASDYLVEVFQEDGKHARAAVGVSGLPMNATVEVEMVVEIAEVALGLFE